MSLAHPPGPGPGPLSRVVAITAAIPMDPFLNLRAAATYSSLSRTTLRAAIASPCHPLPHVKVGGKVLLRTSELTAWLLEHRRVGSSTEQRIRARVARERRSA